MSLNFAIIVVLLAANPFVVRNLPNSSLIKEALWSQWAYRYFEKGCRKNVHAAILNGSMGYDQYIVPNDCSCRTYFCCFHLAFTNICSWPPMTFFQISLKNSAVRTTHNTFRVCCVHFFRQPFSKYCRHRLAFQKAKALDNSCFWSVMTWKDKIEYWSWNHHQEGLVSLIG